MSRKSKIESASAVKTVECTFFFESSTYNMLVATRLILAAAAANAGAHQPHQQHDTSSVTPSLDVRRPLLPVNANTSRALSIVAKMTLAEKASLCNGIKSSA